MNGIEQRILDWLHNPLDGILFDDCESCRSVELARDLSSWVEVHLSDEQIRTRLTTDISSLLQSAVQARSLRNLGFVHLDQPHRIEHLEQLAAIRSADRAVRKVFEDTAEIKTARRLRHASEVAEYSPWYWCFVGKESEGIKPSARWTATRKEYYHTAFEGVQPQCFHCEYSGTLHLHHMTYRTVGFENPCHLVALCEQCHADAHAVNKNLKPPRRCPTKLKRALELEGIKVQ